MDKTKQVDYDERIIDAAATEVMHDAFMTYAEHVTLERALPRVEDGLKPVQRRILYTLYELGITPDKPYKKSARIVGEALGKFHPAGDASVYDAMARMAQDFSMRMPLVDGHGNFGSIDGDGPAAMRYTEVKMAPLTLEMLRDLEKDTVPFRPNYDDTDEEPDLLPARFPNLLVNGSSGIAVGLATNIPPHNLGEVVDAVLYRMKKPSSTLDDIMGIIKGPDFPTGAYCIPEKGLRQAYETGKGKIQVRAKTQIETLKNGKSQIVITEMPYEVKKSTLLERIHMLTESRKDLFSGIEEVRDESDREGMRGVIELKKGVDPQMLLPLLYKYTDMQCTFGINMMAIADGSPKLLSLLDILDGYIKHQKNVVTRRTRFDLEKAEKREHILAGLIIAVDNIDEVIRIIRGAKNTDAAKKELMSTFDLTGVQAQAILDMRLARLNQLEVSKLEDEHAQVIKLMDRLKKILESDKELEKVIQRELRAIRKDFDDPRRTQVLLEESAKIEVDETALLPSEDVVVVQTRSGSLKRMSRRNLQRLADTTDLDERLRVKMMVDSNTRNKVFIFTTTGTVYLLPVLQLPEARLKEAGKTLASLVSGVEKDEEILLMLDEQEVKKVGHLYFATEHGMVKRTAADAFTTRNTRVQACALRDDDRLMYVAPETSDPDLLFVTSDGYTARISKEEVPEFKKAALGVHAARLSAKAKVICAAQVPREGQTLLVSTDKGNMRQYNTDIFPVQKRNGRGNNVMPLNVKNGQVLVGAHVLNGPTILTANTREGLEKFNSKEVPTVITRGAEPVTSHPTSSKSLKSVYANAFETEPALQTV